MVGNNAGRTPLRSVEVDFEHVVGHVLAKTELLVWHLRFGSLRALDDNVGLLWMRELDWRLPRRRRIGQERSSLSLMQLQKQILLIILVATRDMLESRNRIVSEEGVMSQEAFHCEMQVYSGVDLNGTVMNRNGGRNRERSLLIAMESMIILFGLR